MKKKLLIAGLILVGSVGIITKASAADEPTMCTMEYMPVCAAVQVQCIKAPCPPINQTFGNACMMNANKLATYLYDGECKENVLANTKWNIQSFDNTTATGANISFDTTRMSASVCNNKWAAYTIEWNKIIVWPMMSTKMACMGDLATYESAFDLSGASFEVSTDWGNHLMITTLAGHTFQWSKANPTWEKPIGMANPASVNCSDNGWTLNIIDWKDGQYGMCSFSDGSQCEEWAYFRHECKPTSEKLKTVLDGYLSVVRFTEEGYKQFFVNLKAKIDLGLATASRTTKKAYMQIADFLKIY